MGYEKRKKYHLGLLGADAGKLSNQARFILEKCDGKLVIENKKKKVIVEELLKRGYDPDPVKAWMKVVNREKALEEEREEREEEDDEEAEKEQDTAASEFDYLMSMAMWNLTKEKKDALLKKRDEKLQEVDRLKAKSVTDLWEDDLVVFMETLDKWEQKERDEEAGAGSGPKVKGKAAAKGRKKTAEETNPDPTAERVEPKIDEAYRLKVEKAVAALANKGKPRVKKENGIKKEEPDEFDDIVKSNT